jgi:Uma2 family endonuclease
MAPRWTSADLDLFPDDGKRREIIDGELYVSELPHVYHQIVCGNICIVLQTWSDQTGLGRAIMAPGVIFADDDDVAPDVVWISRGRLAEGLDQAGHLRVAPELVVEVLSPGVENERRDREAKLKLYSRRGVDEYWIADWRMRTVTVYRRAGDRLDLVATLGGDDALTSPLLPEFSATIAQFFVGVPIQSDEAT